MENVHEELLKILNYIFSSNIDINENCLFNKQFFNDITKELINKNSINTLSSFITDAHEKELIKNFLNDNDKTINEDTPELISKDIYCIKASLNRNKFSLKYLTYMPEELEEWIIKFALENNIILEDEHPSFLKKNLKVILNSVKLDSTSADFVLWDEVKAKDKKIIVDEIVKNGYILAYDSCYYLKNNKKVVLESIKKDINTIAYAMNRLKMDKDIFRYLLINDYIIDDNFITNQSLENINDINSIKQIFKNYYNIYDSSNPIYIKRINKLIIDSINTIPTKKTFDEIFQYLAEEKWNNHKNGTNDFTNIFGRICTQLRNNWNFYEVFSNLPFLEKMEEVLEDKYFNLYNAMKEYYTIYNNEVSNKYDLLEEHKNMISKMSALYVAKSKEQYKKEWLDVFYDYIKPLFVLRKDHPEVYKKTIWKKKKDIFRKRYINNQIDVSNFIEDIVKKYKDDISIDLIHKMIKEFVVNKVNKLSDILYEPASYNDYLIYKKSLKLINRLNSGYIKFDGIEVFNYLDVISYDEHREEYEYDGIFFTDGEIGAFEKYANRVAIFEKIKREIVSKIKTIDVDEKITDTELNELASELPFTDEYFVFDREKILRRFSVEDLESALFPINISYKEKCILFDESYKQIYDLLITKGLFWISFLKKHQNMKDYSITLNNEYIKNFINNMYEYVQYAKELNFDIGNINNLFILNDIHESSSIKDISILGKELIYKLCENNDYVMDALNKEIVRLATQLACLMVKKDKSTVPYIEGEYLNYKYSMYDSQDFDILACGIDTDACFKVDGNDHAFLHYCALDKNGFVIKITDSYGTFIARAAGFRNGNCVFINQLRTIYDDGGVCYTGTDEEEENDILQTFKMACKDIVKISQENPNEIDKIEHVFVTKSYIFEDYLSNLREDVIYKIGAEPMDNKSEDWENFINTPDISDYLGEGAEEYFETDYGNYPVICVASIKDEADIIPEDIKAKDVPALYKRKRNKYIVTDVIDEEIIRRVNRIYFINNYHDNIDCENPIKISKSSIVCIGDNWFIIFNKEGYVINSSSLSNDEQAKIEFKAVLDALLELLVHDNSKINMDEVNESIDKIVEKVLSKKYNN